MWSKRTIHFSSVNCKKNLESIKKQNHKWSAHACRLKYLQWKGLGNWEYLSSINICLPAPSGCPLPPLSVCLSVCLWRGALSPTSTLCLFTVTLCRVTAKRWRKLDKRVHTNAIKSSHVAFPEKNMGFGLCLMKSRRCQKVRFFSFVLKFVMRRQNGFSEQLH